MKPLEGIAIPSPWHASDVVIEPPMATVQHYLNKRSLFHQHHCEGVIVNLELTQDDLETMVHMLSAATLDAAAVARIVKKRGNDPKTERALATQAQRFYAFEMKVRSQIEQKAHSIGGGAFSVGRGDTHPSFPDHD
jgi:hypothetical protein